ncbi:MAG: tetratricopeptide repeat protein [Aquificaceae bacterium]|nr:tetratricopeptide repeat protein [Aquificaceae bacterium]
MMDEGYKGMFSRMGEALLDKFVEDLKRELELKPDDSELLFKLGVAYSRAGKTSEARDVYKKLREKNPEKAKELLDIMYDV